MAAQEEADSASWVESLERIRSLADIAEGLSLVFVFGPGQLARQGLKQAGDVARGGRRILWHRLDLQGADLSKSLAVAGREPVFLLVHGLESIEPKRRRELEIELNTGRNTLRSFDAFIIFWIPRSERGDLFRFCPDLLQWRTLVVTATTSDVEEYRHGVYDVFLSHASHDKATVEALARRLREDGLQPFLDIWHLIPGEPWQEALEDALEASRTCAVFMGQQLGPWKNEEMRAALEDRLRNGSFRVIPVLLPGALEPYKKDLPRFLRRLTWVDFRNGLDDDSAYHRLVCGIRGLAPDTGPTRQAPEPLYRAKLPPHDFFVHRRELDEVREILIGAAGSTVVITTALHGAGGFGKTALARALCDEPEVRQACPDGILWTTMGDKLRDADRVDRVLDLVRWWTKAEPPGFKSARDAGDYLKKVLVGQRVLVVVDDVWQVADLEPFRGLDPGTVLVTTRNVRALPSDALRVDVDSMTTKEAVEVLGQGVAMADIGRLGALARRLGEWPLLLRLVNSHLSYLVGEGFDDSKALESVESKLLKQGLHAFDQRDARQRSQAVSLTMGVSLDALSDVDRRRFLGLAVFPQDTEVPSTIAARLWDLEDLQAEDLCRHLADLSLLLGFDIRKGTIRLHDVVRQYLIEQHHDLASLHRRLLLRCRPPSGCWADLPLSETYLWSHLPSHLIAAGEREELRRLLFDLDYLEGKIRALGIPALVADYDALGDTGESQAVQEALRLSAYILAQDWGELLGQQLAGQLLGRLERPDGLLKDARIRTPLRPSRPSLTTPGGPLQRTLEGHDYIVSAITMMDDTNGTKSLVSASRDRTLRVWDVATGEAIRVLEGPMTTCNSVAMIDERYILLVSGKTLQLCELTSGEIVRSYQGHSGEINAFAVIDENRVVSASDDETLRVWNLQSGETMQLLRLRTEPHDRMADIGFLQRDGLAASATLLNYRMQMTAVAKLDETHVISSQVTSPSGESRFLVWELGQGLPVRELERHSGKVNAIAVVDRERMISASDDGVLLVWDLTAGEPIQTLEGHSGPVLDVKAIGKDRVVSASQDQTLRTWDLETGQSLVVLSGHTREVTAVAKIDEHTIASGSGDNTVRIWDIRRVEPSGIRVGHDYAVRAFAVIDDIHAVSASADKSLRIWNVQSGEPVRTLNGHTEHVDSVAVIDRGRIISASGDGTLRVWNLETGEQIRTIDCPAGWSHAVAVIDERRAVSAALFDLLQVWDLDSGKSISTLKGHSERVYALAAIGDRVVSASWDQTLRVWDLTTGETLQVLEGHGAAVLAVAMLDAGRAISASRDETLRLWDLSSGRTVRIFEGHTGWVNSVAVVSQNRAVSASNDHTLRVWDLEHGRVVAVFTLDAPALAVAVASSGRRLLAGDQKGGVHFLDLT